MRGLGERRCLEVFGLKASRTDSSMTQSSACKVESERKKNGSGQKALKAHSPGSGFRHFEVGAVALQGQQWGDKIDLKNTEI